MAFPAAPRRRRIRWIGVLAVVGLVLVSTVVAINLLARNDPETLTADQRTMIDKLESVLLHDSETFQYARIVNQHDKRGYVAGRADFSTAGGEVLEVVTSYTARQADNALAREYLPALAALANAHSSADTGLAGFPDAWRVASTDPVFRRVQDQVMQARYFDPALSRAHELNITTPLGLAILCDSLLQHGDGADSDGVAALIERTKATTGGTPVGGSGKQIDERTWLKAFLATRAETLRRPANLDHLETWPYTIGRVNALVALLDAGKSDLRPPISVNPYGTVHYLVRASGDDDVPAEALPTPNEPTVSTPTPTAVATATIAAGPPRSPTAAVPSKTRTPAAPAPTRIDYASFADLSGMWFNGMAGAGTGATLRLTNGAEQAGTAWSKTQILPTRSFSTSFRAVMPGQSDGMAFVIQTAGPTAIGSTGGSIGYGAPAGQPTAPRIQPSVDIEFDTWDNSPDGYDPAGHTHVAVTTNGNNETALVWADPGFPLIDQAFNAWIDYAASAKTIRIYLSQGTYQPANPLVTANVSLAAVLGTGAAYVGFTAGTGVATGTQFVQTWHLTS